MGWCNRLAMRCLVRTQEIVKRRIDLANGAIEMLEANGMLRSMEMRDWQLHKVKLLNRFAHLSLRIAERAQRERRTT